MRKYTLHELRDFVRLGLAYNATNNLPNGWESLEKVGYSSGVNGINGGLLQDIKTGELYVICKRNANLFRCF